MQAGQLAGADRDTDGEGPCEPCCGERVGEVTRVSLRLRGPSLMAPVGYPIPVQGCKCLVSGTKGLLRVIRG